VIALSVVASLLLLLLPPEPDPAGAWRGVLDVAGGPLRFALEIERTRQDSLSGRFCNGDRCEPWFAIRASGDSLTFEIADYAATIRARMSGDSLAGVYHNVGNRGPRTIPFRAARGRWPQEAAPEALLGRWDATLTTDGRTSPRVFLFENGPSGLRAAVISNTGDYGQFGGRAEADSVSIARFDGSFVYMLTARLDGDTLRGLFHAGLRTQTPFTAVRSGGKPHLRAPTEVTQADTTAPFRFAFRDVDGRPVSNEDDRFRGKVVVVDVFGTWCPTCHEAAPVLVSLYRDYHDRGLEIVGLAYEVTGDSAIDGALVRRYRERLGVPFPLLLAGINDTEAAAATLPQLRGFTSFPTTIFLGRDGRVRRVHAGFYGAATGPMHARQIAGFRAVIERLLEEE
jgi:thiol-disulfide isomerase/thioredoxin